MDQLTAMRIFMRVAERSSFTSVAQEFQLTQSQVSRHVSKLEEALGAVLFTRTTRHVSLTPEGQRYLESVRRGLFELDEGAAQLKETRHSLSGAIRIATALPVFLYILSGPLRRIMHMNPGLQLDIRTGVSTVDLIADGIDLAVRAGVPEESGLIARKLCDLPYCVTASPAYLQQAARDKPPIVAPGALKHHDCAWPSQWAGNFWQFKGPDGHSIRVNLTGRWILNESLAIRHILLEDQGVGILPRFIVADLISSGKLVQLLSDYELHCPPLHAIYPASRRQFTRVEIVIQQLLEELGKESKST